MIRIRHPPRSRQQNRHRKIPQTDSLQSTALSQPFVHHGADTRKERIQVTRLLHIFVRTKRKTARFLCALARRAKHHHRRTLIRRHAAQFREHLVAGEIRYIDVKNIQGRRGPRLWTCSFVPERLYIPHSSRHGRKPSRWTPSATALSYPERGT